MRRSRLAIRSTIAMAVWLAMALSPIQSTQAKTPVSIELVLAVDTSASVDGFEYGLLMNGIADAFRQPEVIELIGQQDGVAVTLFQWSSEVRRQYMIPWHLLTGPASVLAFAAKVEAAKRDPNRLFTAIGGAVDFGVRLIAENAYDGRALKIDIAGDGHNNSGIPLAVPRRKAEALGIVINGLPILTPTYPESFQLERYYRREVILGPGAFVEIADDYGDFARAFLRKLQRELAPAISRNEAVPPVPGPRSHARGRTRGSDEYGRRDMPGSSPS